MSMTITLSPETELALAERARVRGQGAEEYAAQVLMDAVAVESPADDKTPAERAAAFEAWMAEVDSRPPVTHFVDASRDSIYGGPDERGER